MMNEHHERKKSWRHLVTLSPCHLVIFCLLAAGCGESARRPRRGATVERLPKLEVVQPKRKRLLRKLEVAATVEALKKVELSARVPGIVAQLDDKMDIGRLVKKEEILVVLAVPELDAEKVYKEALLEQARKQEFLAAQALTVARREVEETEKEEKRYLADVAYYKSRSERNQKLAEQRALDPQIAEEALRQYESAQAALAANKAKVAKQEARVEAAKADLELARQKIRVAEADLKKFKEQIAFASVRAPFDGVITKRWIDPGATIKDPGVPLLTIMEIDRVRILIDVPQRDVPFLNSREQNPNPDHRGDLVTVRLPELAEKVKDGEFRGDITRLSGSLDPVTRTMRAEVELTNQFDSSGRALLKPGMYGTALVLVEDRSDVLTVPASALVKRGEGQVEVYLVAGVANQDHDERQGVLKKVPVVLGIDDGREVEIRGGLKGDELIVARGNGSMRVDDRVIAVSEREAAEDK
jgi:RND family efflux transporter MFP subunit